MALALGKTEIASKLSIGDLVSNEIFYHRSCLIEFPNDFNCMVGNFSFVCYKLIDFIYEKDGEQPR